MKSITRYASLLSACSILAGSALLADNANVPRADNTAGTSGSTNSTTTSGTDSSASGSAATSSSDTTGGAATPRSANTTGTSGSTNNTTPTGPSDSSGMSSNDSSSAGGAATPRSDNSLGTSGSSNNTSPSATNSASNSLLNSSSVGAIGVNDQLSTSLASADYASRGQVAADVEQHLDAQKETLKSLHKEGHHLDGQAKSDFKAAWDDVEARERDLKHSLHQVRNASQDHWDSSRSQLASNYQAFEAAVSRLQAQVSTPMMSK